jgi:glycogen(starch) synthase
MRVLIYSRAFLPMIGGLESSVADVATELIRCGHEVILITTTPGGREERLPYSVLRNPPAHAFLRWMRWCDVFHHANVSLRGMWPLLLVPRPWVVTHHSWYRRPNGRIAWQDHLKRFALRYAAGSISVSQAIADDLETPSAVINNGYRSQLFRILQGAERKLDLVFVGRLVSDKGADVLLDALGILARRGCAPSLTVVGNGPERAALEAQAQRLGLTDRVRFLGTQTGEDLVRILNQHRILVVPSRYNEPFGTAALEGIACGCVVVGTAGGGLKEAIGSCGTVVPNADPAALAEALESLLRNPTAATDLLRAAPAHLAAHTIEGVAQRYLEVFAAAARRGRQR